MQTTEFTIITQFSSIWHMDRTRSDDTTRSHSEPGSDGNKKELHIPQRSNITGTSPLHCLVSYAGHTFGKYYPSAKMQPVHSTAQSISYIYLYIYIYIYIYIYTIIVSDTISYFIFILCLCIPWGTNVSMYKDCTLKNWLLTAGFYVEIKYFVVNLRKISF